MFLFTTYVHSYLHIYLHTYIRIHMRDYLPFPFLPLWCSCFFLRLWFKSESMRGPGRAPTCHLADFDETLPVQRVYPKTGKDKLVGVLDLSGGR